MRAALAGLCALSIYAAACGTKDNGTGSQPSNGGVACPTVSPSFGKPTGAICPSNSTVQYEPEIRAFMSTYCTRCHSSQLKGDEARLCATPGHDFDNQNGILDEAEHVARDAAAGPLATNTRMPPAAYPQPSVAERAMLGEWLACHASSGGGSGGSGGAP